MDRDLGRSVDSDFLQSLADVCVAYTQIIIKQLLPIVVFDLR